MRERAVKFKPVLDILADLRYEKTTRVVIYLWPGFCIGRGGRYDCFR